MCSSFLRLSHFLTENRYPLFLKMLSGEWPARRLPPQTAQRATHEGTRAAFECGLSRQFTVAVMALSLS